MKGVHEPTHWFPKNANGCWQFPARKSERSEESAEQLADRSVTGEANRRTILAIKARCTESDQGCLVSKTHWSIGCARPTQRLLCIVDADPRIEYCPRTLILVGQVSGSTLAMDDCDVDPLELADVRPEIPASFPGSPRSNVSR